MNAEDFYKQEFEKDYELIKDIRNTPVFNLDSVLKFAELYAIKGNTVLAVRCNLSKDDEIALYEKFIDEFTDKDGLMKPCNPDAIFNWFGWQLWRSMQ